jgi:hypothetical protein
MTFDAFFTTRPLLGYWHGFRATSDVRYRVMRHLILGAWGRSEANAPDARDSGASKTPPQAPITKLTHYPFST